MTTRAAINTERRTWSLRTSFWLVIGAQVLLFAGSNFPTPLFPIYEQRYGFGSGVVTLLFGVYVVALIPTLLVLGRVADRIGPCARHAFRDRGRSRRVRAVPSAGAGLRL